MSEKSKNPVSRMFFTKSQQSSILLPYCYWCWLLCCIFVSNVNCSYIDSKVDLVTEMPGADFAQNYRHYSGFLDSSNGSKLHYWFFESSNSMQEDPLVLWLNGGPGCSSMIGALTEIGPIHLGVDGTLQPNPYAWNRKANLLFLETPINVGFSYSTNGKWNAQSQSDDSTAELNVAALKSFYEKFPHLLTNDFYLTGESYAGVFVPTFAKLLIKKNFIPNFKGIAIGNGYLNKNLLQNSRLHHLYHHGLIGIHDWQHLVETCCPAIAPANLRKCNFYASNANNDCIQIRSKFQTLPIDPYNIYDSAINAVLNVLRQQRWQTYDDSSINGDSDGIFEIKEYIGDYLNQEQVRRSLNVEMSPNVWKSCQNFASNYRQQYTDMSESIRFIVNSNVRTVIYNGDVDTVCDFLGAQWFVHDLGLAPSSDYEPWFYGDFVLGGMIQKYQQSLTFVTVLGAGHMVPTDRPEAAFNVLERFIFGNDS